MKTELILFSCCCCEDLENEAPRSSLFGWEIILNRHRRPPPSQGSHAFSFHFHFLVMSYLSYFFLIFGNPALRSIGAFFAIVAYFVSSFYRLSLAAFLYFCLYVSFSQKNCSRSYAGERSHHHHHGVGRRRHHHRTAQQQQQQQGGYSSDGADLAASG